MLPLTDDDGVYWAAQWEDDFRGLRSCVVAFCLQDMQDLVIQNKVQPVKRAQPIPSSSAFNVAHVPATNKDQSYRDAGS